MAPIGTISTHLSVDKPQFSGPNNPVTGTISMVFKPNAQSQSELFGPLQMRIVLKGHMRLHVSENRTSHAYIFFDEQHSLFRRSVEVFNGPFRITAGRPEHIIYEAKLPERVEVTYPGLGRCMELLPPTLKTRFEARAPRQYGHHQGKAEILYTMFVEAEMLGINVEIEPQEEMQVRYEQLPTSSGHFPSVAEISQTLRIESYTLLPEDKRPTSLIGRTKVALSSTPKPVLTFTAALSRVPQYIYTGQSIYLEVRIKAEKEATTALSVSEISLTDGKIDIVGHMDLYATNLKGVDSPRLGHSAIVCSLIMKAQSPPGSFSKPNDYSKTIEFNALPSDLPSSFSMKKLKRSYQARIELRFLVSGSEAVAMKKVVAIQILPHIPKSTSMAPYSSNAGESSIAAGSSLHSTRLENDLIVRENGHEELPRYEEVVGANDGVKL